MQAPAEKEVHRVQNCRICESSRLLTFLQLGPTPAPNGFLEKDQLGDAEKFYPLDVCFCRECGMVQLGHVVNPDVMFKNYVYIPSTSQTMRRHFAGLAKTASRQCFLQKGDLVVDIGSNDGLLLKNFIPMGFKVLGVDPAENLAKKATEEGVETVNALFTRKTAEAIAKKKGKAKLILGTNVFAHVPDLHDFLEGVKILLEEGGKFIVEFPYLADLLDKVEFDTIYQEHLSYFSLSPIVKLAEKHGLGVADVERLPVHGGSLRVTMSPKDKAICQKAEELLETEQKSGLFKEETYLNFGKKVDKIRHELVQMIWGLKLKGKKIVGYGASAKGNVLLNYCRIGPETLDYIVDSISYKQGKFTPGMHIPIFPENKLIEDRPDYALLLAWNFADEIIKKQEAYKTKGGKFILSIPEPKIL